MRTGGGILLATTALAALTAATHAQPMPCGPVKTYSVSPSPFVLIPDNNAGGATVSLTVPDDPLCPDILDIDVSVLVAHTWQGDLRVRLISPRGIPLTLMDRPGVPQTTFGFPNDNLGNPATLEPMTFDDAAPFRYDAGSPGAPVDNVTGSWLTEPGGTLAFFEGQPKAGVWSLQVIDLATGDTGSIRGFALTFVNSPEPATALLVVFGAAMLSRRR